MSMRAASQPSAKKSGNASNHQYSISIAYRNSLRRFRHRRRQPEPRFAPRNSRLSFRIWRRCLTMKARLAMTPSAMPAAKNASSTTTSGACHSAPRKYRTATLSVFFTANPSSNRNTAIPAVALTSKKTVRIIRSSCAWPPAPHGPDTVRGQKKAALSFDDAAPTGCRRNYFLKSTRSRNSLPALKCGTYFAGTCTLSPDFGLRPVRGGR